jgi:hypothetical protein
MRNNHARGSSCSLARLDHPFTEKMNTREGAQPCAWNNLALRSRGMAASAFSLCRSECPPVRFNAPATPLEALQREASVAHDR